MPTQPIAPAEEGDCGNRADAPDAGGSECRAETVLQARRLRAIADRMEDFLLGQILRLETAMQACSLPEDSTHRGISGELQEERARWEAERQHELQRLQEETDRLTEAWERVEAEQRRLLGERESMRAQSRVARSHALGSALPGDPEEALAACGRYRPGEAARETVLDDEPLTAEMAAMQFQQLRREIQKHARRHR